MNQSRKGKAEYYEKTKALPPNEGLVEALAHTDVRGHALDLGCGAGRDTRYLLEQGFEVTAVDSSTTAGENLPSDAIFVASNFDAFSFGPDTYDVINAHFSLPFNPPETFEMVFARLVGSLKSGGLFVGQLFGTNDEWNTLESGRTFHTKEEAEKLLETLEIIKFEETDEDSEVADGTPKHWHFYDIIAKKI